MFNIASIRDSILKKIGTSETGDKTVTDPDAQPINIDGANDSTTIAQTSDTLVQSGHNATTPTLHPQSHTSNLFSVDGEGESSEDANKHQVTGVTLTANHTSLENAQCALTVRGDDKNVSNLPENERCHFQKDSVANKQIQDFASDGDASLPHTDTDVADDVSSTSRHVPGSIDTSAEMMECDDAAEKLVSDVTNLPPASSLDRQKHEKGEDKTGSLAQPAAATEKTADDIVIKTEIIDKGYEEHLTDPARLSFAEVNENIEGFQNVFIKTENSLAEEDVGESDDVVLVGVGYRNPYSDSEGDSDTDTSSLSSFEAPPENKKERQHEEEVVEPRTRGEMYPEDLPPIEDLQISISDETQLLQIGTVSGIVDILVVIQSTVMAGGHVLPVNEDTVFFFEDRKPFGKVFEVFGPTRSPFYSVRFNSREDIVSKGVDVGLKVYFAPDPAPSEAEITHFVFMNSLLKLKGSDASWQDNNEPPPSMVEYSDDEEEKRAKAKRKNAKKQGCGDGDSVNERKRNKHTDGASESGPPSSDRRPGSHQTSTTDRQDPSFDPNQRRFNQSQQSRGRGGFRRGFHGGGPHFSGSHDGQSTQRPPPHTGPSNGTSFLQPSRFSGPGFRMSSGQSPRFSGPPNQMGFQPQAFSGRGRMPAHQQQAFSGPGNGMPPYQLPPFSGANGGMHSHPPRMFWGTNNNNNNNNRQPPPVFSGHSQQRPPFGQWAPNPPY